MTCYYCGVVGCTDCGSVPEMLNGDLFLNGNTEPTRTTPASRMSSHSPTCPALQGEECSCGLAGLRDGE